MRESFTKLNGKEHTTVSTDGQNELTTLKLIRLRTLKIHHNDMNGPDWPPSHRIWTKGCYSMFIWSFTCSYGPTLSIHGSTYPKLIIKIKKNFFTGSVLKQIFSFFKKDMLDSLFFFCSLPFMCWGSASPNVRLNIMNMVFLD